MANYKLNIKAIKILETVYLLNEKSYYPNIAGVHKILNGVIDKETIKFKELTTFSTSISLKGRQLASQVHQLIRYGYLSYRHNKDDDKMYLRITYKGESNLSDYKKHHKVNFLKKTLKEDEPTIVLIKN